MRGLTIIVAAADPVRLRAALEVAAAQAALGRPARLFLQSDAAPLLRHGTDEMLAHMLKEGLALGVAVTVCQSGLASTGMSASELPDGVETSGLIEILASAADDQLLMA